MLEPRDIDEYLLPTERRVIISLRDEGTIGDEALRAIERDLDLEELRLA